MTELYGVLLRDKFQPYLERSRVTAIDIVSRVSQLAMIVNPDQNIKVIDADPADNQVLACAVFVKANFIVSGDRHILGLKQFEGIVTVTAQSFLTIFSRG